MIVEIVYALPDQQRLQSLEIDSGTTVRQAVRLSGFDAFFPELDLERVPVGIFGECVSDEQELRAGDRVELYRPLVLDPMEARRRRAQS